MLTGGGTWKRVGGKSSWLSQRRDYFLRRIISDFLQLSERYASLYIDYRSAGLSGRFLTINFLNPDSASFRERLFEEISSLLGTETAKGLLWRLKDTCHQVWPEEHREVSVNGSIIDWLIGSLFHEAMKLKENVYLLNNYSPSSPRLGHHSSTHGRRLPGDSHALLHAIDTQGVFRRIARDVEEQLEGIGILLGRANYLLRIMMPELAGNDLVVRLLTEKEEVIMDLWGETLDSIFSDMYGGAPSGGFCLAGRSYLSGQWYRRAMIMYQRAADLDALCTEAVTKVIQLQALEREQIGSFGNDAV